MTNEYVVKVEQVCGHEPMYMQRQANSKVGEQADGLCSMPLATVSDQVVRHSLSFLGTSQWTIPAPSTSPNYYTPSTA